MSQDLKTTLKNAVHLAKTLLIDFPVFLRHKISGSSYTEYYAERMNRRLKKNRNWGLNAEKKFQLEYLKAHGLEPRHRFLDYGCGAVNAGRYFIQFLDTGKYTGVDISELAIEEGRSRIRMFSLEEKKPHLILVTGSKLQIPENEVFDIIWAQSVLTHMPPAEIEQLFRDMRPHMTDSTVFFATFNRADRDYRAVSFSDWSYSREKFEEMAAKNRLKVEFMTDWVHPEDPSGRDTMARLTLGSSVL